MNPSSHSARRKGIVERLRLETELKHLGLYESPDREFEKTDPQPDMVSIFLLDPSGVFKDRQKLCREFVSKLENKFNGMDAATLKNASFKFKVIYGLSEPTKAQKANFRKLDFPVYILDAQHTEGVVIDLMEDHKIPKIIKKTDIYDYARKSWAKDFNRGLGIPSGDGYRKVGFIKANLVFRDGMNDLTQAFVNVTAHEIGHMGNRLNHSEKGLMKYPLPLDKDIAFDPRDKTLFISDLVRLRQLRIEPATGASREFFLREYDNPVDAKARAVFPKWLKLLDHFHMRKSPVPTAATPSSVSLEKLEPGGMNPGFIDEASDEIIVDKAADGLDARLKRLIAEKYSKYRNEIRVALVNLTGNKLFSPDYAGWHSTVLIEGASCVKAAALYAAYQLRCDLNALAATDKITSKSDLAKAFRDKWKKAKFITGPVLTDEYFVFTENAPNPVKVDFTDSYKTVFGNLHSRELANSAATTIIKQTGFEYIGSVIAQSGLWHINRKGVWLNAAYLTGVVWKDSPVGGFYHNSTALSLASLFTLLAQGRLADDRSSDEMKRILEGASWYDEPLRNKYQKLVDDKAIASMPPIKIVSKVGLLLRCLKWQKLNGKSKCVMSEETHKHDGAIVERGRFRYVAAILTDGAASREQVVERLIVDLDDLIENKSP
jgi:hypothetical protein